MKRRAGQRVFVLGAGFSRYAGFPLVRDLKDIVLDMVRGPMREKFSPYLEQRYGYPQGQFDEGLQSVPDGAFEEILGALIARTRLAERQGDSTHPSYTTLRVLRETTSRALWERHERLAELPAAYLAFGRKLLKTRSRVISFNWDVLVERAVTDSAGPAIAEPWSYSTHRAGQVPILKPHGSINWNGFLRAGAFSYHDVWRTLGPESKLSYPFLEPLFDPDVQGINEPYRHMLFPGDSDGPGDADLDLIWQESAAVLAEANDIVFLGYSLPVYDEESARFFRRACAAKHVEVVNPSDEDIERFREALQRGVTPITKRFEDSPYATDEWPARGDG